MHFSFYLYGNFNGSLLVAIEEDGTTTAPPIWERSSQWTDDWEDVAVQLTGHHGYVKTKGERREAKSRLCNNKNSCTVILFCKSCISLNLHVPLFALFVQVKFCNFLVSFKIY